MNRFELIQSDDYPEFDLKITLKPSFRCNQNCWFCSEYNNDETDWSLDDCNLVLDKLKTLTSFKRIFIYFYGGEPTLSIHWEYLQYKIIDIFKDNELFMQTQTNLSIKKERLEIFLNNISNIKSPNHKIDICSSYHLFKQDVQDFKEKMDICNSYSSLGLCFFNTDIINEHDFINEFTFLLEPYPDKIKLRFTEISENTIDSRYRKKYPDMSSDEILHYEYRYLMEKYPHFNNYFEKGFNFKIDDRILNFSEMTNEDIHKQFRLMKCECGNKNIVIDQNLKVYHCNDDFKNNINIFELKNLELKTFVGKPVFCLNKSCYDGLEFTKWRENGI